MESLFRNILTASFHGSIVILVVILLRVLLKKTPRKFICFLWVLAGLRLLMPFEIQSSLSLQPMPEVAQVQQWREPEAAPYPGKPSRSRLQSVRKRSFPSPRLTGRFRAIQPRLRLSPKFRQSPPETGKRISPMCG